MLTDLTIKNFRGIREGKLDGFTKLNLLVGRNNSGKTTVLESIALAQPPFDQLAVQFLSRHRGAVDDVPLSGPPDSTEIVTNDTSIRVNRTNGQYIHCNVKSPTYSSSEHTMIWRLSDSSSGFASDTLQFIDSNRVVSPGELENAVSLADEHGKRRVVLSLLKPLMPKLTDLRLVMRAGRATLLVEEAEGESTWPASLAGDGFKRLVLLACQMAIVSKGLVLIEDPEAFQHYGALRQLAMLFWAADEAQETQIVMTTHSMDFVECMIENVNGDSSKDIRVFQLERSDGKLTAKSYSGSQMQAASRKGELRRSLGYCS